ncbi:PEP-CTERM sorting domain-containing protein, partial [bacterium]|nr:PEP-CTERM sorting domain-containing protein [bacterium]
MKKLLIVMVLGLCLSFGYIGQANAVPTVPWGIEEMNFVTDNSAEYLLNRSGTPGNYTYSTDDGDALLDMGDRLRGMFEIDDLSYLTTTIDLTSAGIELTGVFDIEVTSKTLAAIQIIPGYTTYVYEFGPTATFEADYGTGAMIAWYVDDYGDGDDYNRLGPEDAVNPSSVEEENRIDTADNDFDIAPFGDYYWSFGFLGLDGEGWSTGPLGAPENVGYFNTIPISQSGGSGNLALNLIQNQLGPELAREVLSPYGNDVDFAATTGFVGILGQTTPMDVFDNFDGAIKPVPEPATMLLLGSGLLG